MSIGSHTSREVRDEEDKQKRIPEHKSASDPSVVADAAIKRLMIKYAVQANGIPITE
jgi:hypothetical protein